MSELSRRSRCSLFVSEQGLLPVPELKKMAANTMDAIKKKMQAMKVEKENAFDRADQLEQKLNEQKNIYDMVNTIIRNSQ